MSWHLNARVFMTWFTWGPKIQIHFANWTSPVLQKVLHMHNHIFLVSLLARVLRARAAHSNHYPERSVSYPKDWIFGKRENPGGKWSVKDQQVDAECHLRYCSPPVNHNWPLFHQIPQIKAYLVPRCPIIIMDVLAKNHGGESKHFTSLQIFTSHAEPALDEYLPRKEQQALEQKQRDEEDKLYRWAAI